MLKIKYKLVGTGWSECVINTGKKKIMITASYIGEALPELAHAVIDILKGKKKSRANFEEEPGQYRWVFTRRSKNIDIKIFEFKDFWSKEADKDGKLLFTHICTIEEFTAGMLDCINDVFKKYGLRKYKAMWVSDFPLQAYKEIKKLSKLI